MTRFSSITAALLMLSLVGCATQQRVYSVTLRNDTSHELTLVLTKDGGPVETNWISPEESATLTPQRDELPVVSAVVPPGQVARLGPLQGRFFPDARAVLRVYAGAFDLDQLLSFPRGDPMRIDVVLREGPNLLVVPPGLPLEVQRAEPVPEPPR